MGYIDEVVIERNRMFFIGPFWLKFTENPCFFKEQVLLWSSSLAEYTMYAVPMLFRWMDMERWLHSLFGRFFHKFSVENFVKIQFSINFLLYRKFSTFSLPQVPQSEACQFNWGTFQAKCILMGFNSSLDFERTFLKNLLAIIVKW